MTRFARRGGVPITMLEARDVDEGVQHTVPSRWFWFGGRRAEDRRQSVSALSKRVHVPPDVDVDVGPLQLVLQGPVLGLVQDR